MEIQIKGHSGCQIEIVNDGNELFIYKSSHDKKYINRLYLQACKQKEAGNNAYQHIRIPKIYDIKKTNTSLIIKMEYIYSQDYIDYFEDAGFDNISYFIQTLKNFIDFEIDKSTIQKINKSIILNKFADVCKQCKNNHSLNTDKEFKTILQECEKKLFLLDDEIEIPLGRCHGDLTFSNILFNGNNYYLIDFLDSFIESPLMDIVKIRQDSRHKWSRLMAHKEHIDLIRLNIISDKIDKEINTYYDKCVWYKKYYNIFQMLNFLRILQYAQDKEIIIYLKNELKSMP